MTGPTLEVSLSAEFTDREAYDRLHAGGGALFTIKQTFSTPVPCPSIWRRPIAWLRWNPLLEIHREITIPDCKVEFL